jgi:hypothetical protein
MAAALKPGDRGVPENFISNTKNGRYWDRTSDLFGVNEALSH